MITLSIQAGGANPAHTRAMRRAVRRAHGVACETPIEIVVQRADGTEYRHVYKVAGKPAPGARR